MKNYLRIEETLSEKDRCLRNPFIFCMPIQPSQDKSAKSVAIALAESLSANIPPHSSAKLITVSEHSSQTSEFLDINMVKKTN